MGLELKGFDSLVEDLNRLGDVGNKIGKKAIEEGSKIVLDQQKKDAPRDKNDNEHGADKLKVTNIKRYKTGAVVGKIGIDSSNWESTKHLYFQHYGYELWKNGERVEPHLGWMNDSFKKVEEKTSDKIIEVANKELDNILK